MISPISTPVVDAPTPMDLEPGMMALYSLAEPTATPAEESEDFF